jgi:hypothetical protein
MSARGCTRICLLSALLIAFPLRMVNAQNDESSAESRNRSATHGPRVLGSPYVELDSWIYPAMERLAALGYIHTDFMAMRPWARLECAHLLEEAHEEIRASHAVSPEVNALYGALSEEFAPDLNPTLAGRAPVVHLESLYAGSTEIAGRPLTDSYHFGQTIINNFGRPYERGFNTSDGFSGWTTADRFVVYIRGEYQHAPSAPPYSQSVRDLIASVDDNPVQPAAPVPQTNQFRLLDTYAAAHLAGWNLAFGKQSLWWGPGEGGDLIFSDNAEPIYMFRASRITPFIFPWIFHWLGPAKVDAFVGKLSGNSFPPRTLLHGEKLTIKPTPNLEFSISRTGEFGGVGRALTPAAIWNTYFVFNQSSVQYPASKNPGKRTGGIDFLYRVPFARDWLTVYAASLSSDDPSPLSNPPRAAFNPGIYMPQLPRLEKLDFRFEAVYTNPPIARSNNGDFIYWETFYHDLYTNKGNIIGSWIGREGMGFQAWTTYWIGARDSLQIGYRHAKVAEDFIQYGETANDGSIKLNWWPRRDLSISGLIQYEKWLAPILAPGPQTNWTTSIEISFQPQGWSHSLHISPHAISSSSQANGL